MLSQLQYGRQQRHLEIATCQGSHGFCRWHAQTAAASFQHLHGVEAHWTLGLFPAAGPIGPSMSYVKKRKFMEIWTMWIWDEAYSIRWVCARPLGANTGPVTATKNFAFDGSRFLNNRRDKLLVFWIFAKVTWKWQALMKLGFDMVLSCLVPVIKKLSIPWYPMW